MPVLSAGDLTILIADDDPYAQKALEALLSVEGFRVITAQDGQEALDIYKKEGGRIDVSVIDITMPRMTGLAVLKEIVAINPRAKVILCSGYTIEGSAEELMRAGAKLFIPKPYTIQTLAMGLRQVIESSKI
jgi:DNA-binding NtrC family response regulator